MIYSNCMLGPGNAKTERWTSNHSIGRAASLVACLSIDSAYRPIGDGFVVQETNGFEFRGNAKAT